MSMMLLLAGAAAAANASGPPGGQLPLQALYSQSSVHTGCEPADAASMQNGNVDEPTKTGTERLATPEWVQMDFGSELHVEWLKVGCDFNTVLGNSGWGPKYAEDLIIEISANGTDWIAVGNTGKFTHPIQAYRIGADARYLRVTNASPSNGGYIAITEFAAYGVVGALQQPLVVPQQPAGEDPDAKAYLDKVEAADGSALEPAVRTAVNVFVKGCKTDGIWASIQAACILAGAKTLAGALVPLIGPAPTNNNFVSGDYNRKTGLIGDESTKYLNSNRAGDADPQDNHHASVYVSDIKNITNQFLLSNGNSVKGAIGLQETVGTYAFRSQTRSETGSRIPVTPDALVGVSRDNSSTAERRVGATQSTGRRDSETPGGRPVFIFASPDSSNSPEIFSNARLSFYSIGESLDLALLNARLTTLMADLAAAIP